MVVKIQFKLIIKSMLLIFSHFSTSHYRLSLSVSLYTMHLARQALELSINHQIYNLVVYNDNMIKIKQKSTIKCEKIPYEFPKTKQTWLFLDDTPHGMALKFSWCFTGIMNECMTLIWYALNWLKKAFLYC